MENLRLEDSSSLNFVWRIPNFSKLKTEQHYSDIFVVGGSKWRVIIFPKGYNEDLLSLSLERNDDDSAKLVYAEFSLAVLNRINGMKTFKYDGEHQFAAKDRRSFHPLLPLGQFNDPSNGYLVNDTCMLKVKVSIWRIMDNPACELVEALQASQKVQLGAEYPTAGKPFEGRSPHHKLVVLDEKFEDIGGFNVLKTQASLYEKIWLKYGHIASSEIPTGSSYIGQVWLVADVMSSVMDMHQCCLPDVSSEMLDLWENKIKMAETLEFNIGWLREHYEDVKNGFHWMQKFKTTLKEKGQPLRAAKARVILAEDELKKAQARLIVARDEFRDNISAFGSESEIDMYLEKCNSTVFEGLF